MLHQNRKENGKEDLSAKLDAFAKCLEGEDELNYNENSSHAGNKKQATSKRPQLDKKQVLKDIQNDIARNKFARNASAAKKKEIAALVTNATKTDYLKTTKTSSNKRKMMKPQQAQEEDDEDNYGNKAAMSTSSEDEIKPLAKKIKTTSSTTGFDRGVMNKHRTAKADPSAGGAQLRWGPVEHVAPMRIQEKNTITRITVGKFCIRNLSRITNFSCIAKTQREIAYDF